MQTANLPTRLVKGVVWQVVELLQYRTDTKDMKYGLNSSKVGQCWRIAKAYLLEGKRCWLYVLLYGCCENLSLSKKWQKSSCNREDAME